MVKKSFSWRLPAAAAEAAEASVNPKTNFDEFYLKAWAIQVDGFINLISSVPGGFSAVDFDRLKNQVHGWAQVRLDQLKNQS